MLQLFQPPASEVNMLPYLAVVSAVGSRLYLTTPAPGPKVVMPGSKLPFVNCNVALLTVHHIGSRALPKPPYANDASSRRTRRSR